MVSLILYSIFSVIITALILAIVAFSLLRASTNDFHPILIFVILILGLLCILAGTYRIIMVGMDSYDLGSDSLFGGIFGVYGDISQNIWFSLGSIAVNYSIVRGAITLTSAAGILLGAIKFVVDKIKKK